MFNEPFKSFHYDNHYKIFLYKTTTNIRYNEVYIMEFSL
jgi:hypothetical protein